MSIKKLIVGLLMALCAAPALASFTVNASAAAYGGTTSQAVTISIASGHTVVAMAYTDGAACAVTVSDSGAGSYTAGTEGSNTGRAMRGFVRTAISGSITSVTATAGGTCSFIALVVWDISATGTVYFNSSAGAFSTSGATDGISTGSMALGTSDGLIIGGALDLLSGGVSAGTGFTLAQQPFSQSMFEHKAVSAASAATFTGQAGGVLAISAGVALQVGAPAAPPSTAFLAM